MSNTIFNYFVMAANFYRWQQIQKYFAAIETLINQWVIESGSKRLKNCCHAKLLIYKNKMVDGSKKRTF